MWDGPLVSDYISKEYNVEMNVRSCQLLLHRHGFSLVRPQTYPPLANPDENTRDEFKKLRQVNADPRLIAVTGTIFENHKISITEWMEYTLNILRYVSINADS